MEFFDEKTRGKKSRDRVPLKTQTTASEHKCTVQISSTLPEQFLKEKHRKQTFWWLINRPNWGKICRANMLRKIRYSTVHTYIFYDVSGQVEKCFQKERLKNAAWEKGGKLKLGKKRRSSVADPHSVGSDSFFIGSGSSAT
jgi:hypothetical protein